jgi:antitoxin ParD1/3/4
MEQNMNVSLTNELEEYVSTQVKSGLYNSASEVIQEALRNQIKKTMTGQLNKRLSVSRKQVENGQVLLADNNYFESKRERVRQKDKSKKL